ncbi:MAG: hypothetical protein HYV94_14440 [Candidatus Rokubacteria bacterium]|nr:hypothetical protein [Candidatus Rokubacteria bacterium]
MRTLLALSLAIPATLVAPLGGGLDRAVVGLAPVDVLVEGLRDLAGGRPGVAVAFTLGALGVRIVAPAPGETVPAGLVLVSGVVEGGAGDLGVVVNGAPAAVEAGAFHALVPVGGAAALLTAVATTARGERATHTVAVGVAPDASPLVALECSRRISHVQSG